MGRHEIQIERIEVKASDVNPFEGWTVEESEPIYEISDALVERWTQQIINEQNADDYDRTMEAMSGFLDKVE